MKRHRARAIAANTRELTPLQIGAALSVSGFALQQTPLLACAFWLGAAVLAGWWAFVSEP